MTELSRCEDPECILIHSSWAIATKCHHLQWIACDVTLIEFLKWSELTGTSRCTACKRRVKHAADHVTIHLF